MVSTFVKGFIPGGIGVLSALIPFPLVPVIVLPIALAVGGIMFKGFATEEDGMKYIAGAMVICAAGAGLAGLLGMRGMIKFFGGM